MTLNVGFVGCGRISDLHARYYAKSDAARIYAVCDADPELAQRRAAEWSAVKVYTDYHDLVQDPDVHAVEVLTPHDLHEPMVLASLGAGKHTSVQKPMALNVEQADRMVEAAQRTDRLFRVFENYRFYPPHQQAKQLIDAGEIGDIVSVRFRLVSANLGLGWKVPESAMTWRRNETRCGGGPVTFDHGYHVFSMAQWLAGEAERVFAWIERTERSPGLVTDGPAIIAWKYKGKPVFGHWEICTARELLVKAKYYSADESIEITGSRGIIWVNGCTGRLLDQPSVCLYRDGKVTEFHNLETDWGVSFELCSQHFVEAINEGRPAQIQGPEAREVLRFALAAQQSAREHREVLL